MSIFLFLFNSPYNLSDLEQGYDDSQTPVVRTISIEEEEPTHDLTVLVATAVAALQEQGSLIDANLLVRLLLNLINERGMATNVVSLNAAHAGSAKSMPLTMTQPDIRENKSVTYSLSELDLKNIKKSLANMVYITMHEEKFLSWFPDMVLPPCSLS